jgi:Domain of unknown function (DUF5103)
MKYLSFLLLLTACTPLTQSSTFSESNPKTLRFTDFIYEPQIETVLLHPGTDVNANLLPAVAKRGEENLILEFDDLRNQRDTYAAHLIHCNHDWAKSDLMDLDFLTDYNEFNITNFQFSVDTHIPYIHYTFNIPPVKLPGNYLVVVYRLGYKDDIILSKRFMVYDSDVSFARDRNLVNAGRMASLNQQINFTIKYDNITIPNPMENVWVVIRQNQRWDNSLTELKPTFIRE